MPGPPVMAGRAAGLTGAGEKRRAYMWRTNSGKLSSSVW